MSNLGLGLARFAASSSAPPPAARVLETVNTLIMQSRIHEALSLLESRVRLDAEAYGAPARLVEHLRERLEGEGQAAANQLLAVLCWLLTLENRVEDARKVLLASCGVAEAELVDRTRLPAGILARLAGLDPALRVSQLVQYANLLQTTWSPQEGIGLLLQDLGLAEGWTGDDFVSAVEARLEGLLPEVVLLYCGALSTSLGIVDHDQESGWVFKALARKLELDEGDVATSILRGVESISVRNTAVGFLFHLAIAMDAPEQNAVRLSFLERHLGLESADYRDLASLTAKLHWGFSEVLPGTAANYTMALTAALQSAGRRNDALAVFRADVGFQEGDDPKAAGAALRARLEVVIPPTMALIYATQLVDALSEDAEPDAALGLLEGYLGLTEEHYANAAELAGWIRRQPADLGSGALSIAVVALLSLFEEAEEDDKMRTLLEVFDEVSGGLRGRRGDDSDMAPLLAIYSLWLRTFGRSAPHCPLDHCRDLVAYLRANFASHGTQLEDRLDLIRRTDDLRRLLLDTGLHWAAEDTDPEASARITIETQLWDAELTHRVLVERFLLEPLYAVPPGPMPTREWSWSDPEPPPSCDPLPPPFLSGAAAGTLQDWSGGVALATSTEHRVSRLREDHPALFERARQLVLAGVDEARLAATLGPEGLLLRGGFSAAGAFRWFALRSDGAALRRVGSGSGVAGDVERLRWAAARHEFRLALARFRGRSLPVHRSVVEREVAQALREVLYEIDRRTPTPFVEMRLQWARSRFQNPWFWGDAERLLWPILQNLKEAPERGEGFPRWAAATTQELKRLLALLAQPAQSLREALDEATADYLAEVRPLLGLDALAPSLTADLDVVVQLEDTLHRIPLAHLPVDGQPLFRCVRSLRSSIAVLLTSLQMETERAAGTAAEAPSCLLSVAHFAAADRARRGALWLQRGFSLLAREQGWTAYAAADEPAGTVGLLRRALAEFPALRVVAICGHGDARSAGIQLGREGEDGDELWRGDGCDLSGVDWLWMVSCSIGRLEQSLDLDVEGFCVKLALRRARSVSAFRWPVNSAEAVALVIESVRLYLQSSREGGDADSRCLRARALNDARKSFFGDGVNPPRHGHVSLCTAAAGELFGLG